MLPRPRDDQAAPEDKDCEAQIAPRATQDDKKDDQKLAVSNETVHVTDHEETSDVEIGGPPVRRITFGPESGRHEAKVASKSFHLPLACQI